ncbi:MAG: FAD binding domain-containing protein, partial [Planctomycetes bacterium]|nr:FAD binding domain-containing protein [Planctomycetota bacterium]
MNDFDYAAPQSVDEALKLLGSGSNGVAFLAGGTDILVQLREGHREAELVIDLKKIPELTELSFSPSNGLTLGAATPCYQIYGNPEITAAYPALADATRIIGGWQIQSRASVGGNLCNSSPAADSIPALIASDARCNIAGPSGRRSVSVAEFCTAPGRNVLQANEFLVNLQFPAPQSGAGSHYLRF